VQASERVTALTMRPKTACSGDNKGDRHYTLKKIDDFF